MTPIPAVEAYYESKRAHMAILEATFLSKRAPGTSAPEAASTSTTDSPSNQTATDDSNSSSDTSDAAVLRGRYNAFPVPDWSAAHAKRMQGIKEVNETLKKLEAMTLESGEKKKKNKAAGGSSKKR